MKSFIKIIMLTVMVPVVFCIGCAGTPLKVDAIDQQFDRSKIDFTRPRLISASLSGYQILVFIPLSINDRQAQAYDMLMAQAGTDYITDIKIRESWTYIFIGTIYTTEIAAIAYPRKN